MERHTRRCKPGPTVVPMRIDAGTKIFAACGTAVERPRRRTIKWMSLLVATRADNGFEMTVISGAEAQHRGGRHRRAARQQQDSKHLGKESLEPSTH